VASQSQTLEEQRKLSEAQERYRREQAESSLADRSIPTAVPAQSKPAALGFWKIALAVFAGNLMTGIVAAIIYAITH
jgi:hypothetical protein